MNKFKSPMVKALRKAGYSNKDAMNIALDIEYNTANQNPWYAKLRNHIFHKHGLDAMFVWSYTAEGFGFWSEVYHRLNK